MKRLWERFKKEVAVYRCALRHPRTPWLARLLLGLAVAYALNPWDLVPDVLPLLGHLDDALILPLLVWLALRVLPPEVMAQCREEVYG